MNERAIRLLQRHGWKPGAVLGVGMEGTVVDLSADAVAKIWHGRSRTDLDALLRFGRALGESALPFAVPNVLELLEDGDLVITIERKVLGRPLRPDRVSAPSPVTDDAARMMGDVLDGLSHMDTAPGLAALPILPGDQPFDAGGSFTTSLADLVERRFDAGPELLRREVDDIDTLVPAIVGSLRKLPEDPAGLIHGDLIPANVLVRDGHVSGVLDFGFLTTVGDPQFDAAITASIFDMYGPNARASEIALSKAFVARFGHDPDRYGVYRAAYAVITHGYFGTDGADGHFAWCARLLRRPDVRAAVLS